MTSHIKFISDVSRILAAILKLYAALLLLTLLAGAALAQGGGPSVMIYAYGKQGTDAEAISHLVRDQIGIGLEQYPCIDQNDDSSLAALLGWERSRQLLGQEPNDEMMQNLAGAVGARYIIVVSATTLPNGQTFVTTKVIDSRTGRTIANRSAPPVNAENAVATGDAQAKQILQDLAGLFKGQCEPHWTGTITYTLKYRKGESKSTAGSPGAMESNVKVDVSYSDQMENTVEALLQPMSLGTEGTKTMSRVTHRFIYFYEKTASRTSTVRCRPPGAESYLKQTSGNSKEIIDERGQNTETLPVFIYVAKSTGNYEISVQFPAVTTRRNEERSGVASGCTSEPYSEVAAGEGSPEYAAFRESGSFTVRGQIDPQNPDVLAGREITGDLENGQYTMTWNLRLVKSKTRK